MEKLTSRPSGSLGSHGRHELGATGAGTELTNTAPHNQVQGNSLSGDGICMGKWRTGLGLNGITLPSGPAYPCVYSRDPMTDPHQNLVRYLGASILPISLGSRTLSHSLGYRASGQAIGVMPCCRTRESNCSFLPGSNPGSGPVGCTHSTSHELNSLMKQGPGQEAMCNPIPDNPIPQHETVCSEGQTSMSPHCP